MDGSAPFLEASPSERFPGTPPTEPRLRRSVSRVLWDRSGTRKTPEPVDRKDGEAWKQL